MKRFRQIVAAINRRNFLRRRDEISLLSWQTRHLASFIAAGYMTEKGKGNPGLDAASTLAFDEIEEEQIKESQMRTAGSGSTNSPMFDEDGEIIPILTKVRSEFDVMNAFGDPSKWRGKG